MEYMEYMEYMEDIVHAHIFFDYLQELDFHDFSIEHSFQRNEELTLFEGL